MTNFLLEKDIEMMSTDDLFFYTKMENIVKSIHKNFYEIEDFYKDDEDKKNKYLSSMIPTTLGGIVSYLREKNIGLYLIKNILLNDVECTINLIPDIEKEIRKE